MRLEDISKGLTPSKNGVNRLNIDGILKMLRWCWWEWHVLFGTLKTRGAGPPTSSAAVAVSEKDATVSPHNESDS